jgi:hypothetical protein
MGFDWGAFATGFLKETAKNINEAKEDAKDYEERQRELAERNKLTISKRNAVANEVISISNMLRDNGASQAVIQAAVSAGPKAIADLANKVNNARDIYGRKLNSDDIETLVNMPENFSVIDMDTEDFIKKTYGLGYEGAGTTESKPERTLMDRLSGRKLRDMARYRLDSEVMQEGLTAYDINQMAAQTDYESLVPGTFVTFNEVKYFNPATDMASFSRTFTSLVDDVEDSAEFKEIEREINRAQRSVEGELADISDEDRAKLVQEVLEKRNALYRRSLQPYVDSMVSTYGDSFLDNTKESLKFYLGDSYVDSLSFEPEEDEEEEAETVDDLTKATLETPDDTVAQVSAEVDETEDEDITLELPQPTTPEEPKGLMTPAPSTLSGDEFSLAPDQGYPYPTDAPEAQQPEVEDQPQINVKSVREKTEKKFGLSKEKQEELIETGEATEMDFQLLTDSGDDILDFIKKGNYALSSMGVTEGLSDWADKNKKQLPFNMNYLIRFVVGTLRASQE